MSFAAWPEPVGPQWRTREPMRERRCVAGGIAEGGEPSIKVSVPAVAPITPPETGASMNVPKAGEIRLETCNEVETSVVEESTNSFGIVEGEGL